MLKLHSLVLCSFAYPPTRVCASCHRYRSSSWSCVPFRTALRGFSTSQTSFVVPKNHHKPKSCSKDGPLLLQSSLAVHVSFHECLLFAAISIGIKTHIWEQDQWGRSSTYHLPFPFNPHILPVVLDKLPLTAT